MDSTRDTRIVNWQSYIKRKIEESIISGRSLARIQLSSLMNRNISIVCGIVVQNWTNIELRLPCVTVNTGSIFKPPTSVSPGEREAVIAYKYGFSMMGTSGLMSWLLSELGRRVVVMWNVPYFTSANTLAVGITTKGSTVHNDTWYTKIESSSDIPDLRIKQRNYYATCNEIMIEDDCIEVLGTMGTGSTPIVNIIIRPKLHKYLSITEN